MCCEILKKIVQNFFLESIETFYGSLRKIKCGPAPDGKWTGKPLAY